MKIWRVPYPKFATGDGLARVNAIASLLGLDLGAFGGNGAAITGSNGKGSTAAMLASILEQGGGPVGLFISPHLFRLNERFRIDGDDISDEELERHWERVGDAIATWRKTHDEEAGGFEFLFLIAADWFAARGCAHAVWEAGIGGRYDPVRLIAARRAALTSLDLEHTQLLGETLEEIARDKLDAAPAGARVFVGEVSPPLRDVIEAHCKDRNVTAVFPAQSEQCLSPLAGAHQRGNAALALALARDMAPALTQEQMSAGLAATRWPGRLEIIETEPRVVIDVGHTPEAIRAALSGFLTLASGRARVLVCGASRDKNAAAMIAALAPSFPVIIAAAARHKGAPAAEIAAAAAAANPGAEIAIAESMADARRLALAKARSAGAAVYVAGGLFLAAEFKAAHLGVDPASLAFF